jgi:hypothetical protein
MKLYAVTDIIKEVAQMIKTWGIDGSPSGVQRCGGWFEYWEEVNRRGQFKLKDGRVAVLEPAELRLALELATDKP